MARTGEDRVLTVPNALSVIRLLFIPLFLWLLFGRENRHAAAWLLAALCTSDWVDGYIARHFNQVSNLGKILDPTADRILLGVGGVAIIVDGSIPAWVGILALARELVVGVAGIVLGLMGARRIDVLLVGKAGNFLLMLAFPLFLASNPDGGAPWHAVARPLAWLCALPGLVLSYYSAYRYVPLAKEALGKGCQGKGRVGSRRR
ncbi:MAG TPA: CDP-alcohol phosphatidyltransferase family protein [Acidimicrobiales bacterium]|nr:CDP-alcohol phosphatidyltransferase family protein [Acidimicrobiales bacterium]